MTETTKPIAVIGAGTMGAGLAQLFASNSHSVILIDANPETLTGALARIRGQLQNQAEFGFLQTDIEQVLANIEVSGKLENVKEAWLVIEAIPEKKELKQALLSELEEVTSADTILATNTSGISIDHLAEGLKYPKRFIGTHFFMPAEIIPLVEVIKGKATSDVTVDRVMALLETVKKKPVLIKKDIPGFIGNRIQHAMAREAIFLLEEGVATAEDIDTVVRWSLGPRLLFTGPLEQRDLNGLDVHLHIASYLYKELENRTSPAPMLASKVANNELGLKSGQGFYDWKDKDQQTILEKKNTDILKLMKALQSIE
ncbi:3-hydroxyacyl-CoA dehydrogenase family protein [Cytobacillus purgationiresistens]|uniref:3-hydroxybutyryl-CoA dehydrogenase n=1 Tax=Cytobacillus purgationiresistens TaxID=863449 RepID=A0ABU0APL6_9BACI|nr:3-hydroxyacyl-CoA dehydrogenase NAD-binding domain-containing protein [Cytobacillus purgationiresistens]MDQ0273145.1 3-hydroxybutyryl-CoA dehydrogenase [Cytobacillus purgationiresistens]